VRLRIFRIADLVVLVAFVAFISAVVLIVALFRADVIGGFSVAPQLILGGLQLCVMAPRVAIRAMWWRRTRYFITTRRVVITGGRTGMVTASEKLTDLEPPVTTERADGSGSLAFGRFPGIRESLTFHSNRWWRWPIEEVAVPVLWDVRNVRRIHRRVVRAQGAAIRRRAARLERRRAARSSRGRCHAAVPTPRTAQTLRAVRASRVRRRVHVARRHADHPDPVQIYELRLEADAVRNAEARGHRGAARKTVPVGKGPVP
jgi:hypothetical protein